MEQTSVKRSEKSYGLKKGDIVTVLPSEHISSSYFGLEGVIGSVDYVETIKMRNMKGNVIDIDLTRPLSSWVGIIDISKLSAICDGDYGPYYSYRVDFLSEQAEQPFLGLKGCEVELSSKPLIKNKI